MQFFFILSGEHPALPAAEARAVLEAEQIKYEPIMSKDQVLVVKCHTEPSLQRIAERTAFTHRLCIFLGRSSPEIPEIKKQLSDSALPQYIKSKTKFRVRAKRIKKYSPHINLMEVEQVVGDAVWQIIEGAGKKPAVDLENPEFEIYLVFTENTCLIGLTSELVDRKQYEKRKPQNRPFFHPGVIIPRDARAIVNLSRVGLGESLLDPFCGTGGILIEAGLIGTKPIGADIDPQMIVGTRKNLEFYGIKPYELFYEDARNLDISGEADAIATDPPYGVSAATFGIPLQKLYAATLENVWNLLRDNHYICISSPAKVNIQKIGREIGYVSMERYEQRIHKSLTRSITVFRKE